MYLSPPVVTVYFLGVGWRRANAQGAMAAFAVGYTLGFGRSRSDVLERMRFAHSSDQQAPVAVAGWWVRSCAKWLRRRRAAWLTSSLCKPTM